MTPSTALRRHEAARAACPYCAERTERKPARECSRLILCTRGDGHDGPCVMCGGDLETPAHGMVLAVKAGGGRP